MFTRGSMKGVSLAVVIMVFLVGCSSSNDQATTMTYASQEPLVEPRIFQEGLISTNNEQNISFTPDGSFVIYEKAGLR